MLCKIGCLLTETAYFFCSLFALHHAAHSAAHWHLRSRIVFFFLSNHTFGSEEHAGN